MQWEVWRAYRRYSRIENGDSIARVGMSRLAYDLNVSYSTIQRTTNQLQAIRAIEVAEREQPQTSSPRAIRVHIYTHALNFIKKAGGALVRRNRGVKIFDKHGEPVDLKRPPLPPLRPFQRVVEKLQQARQAVKSVLGSTSKSLEELGRQMAAKDKERREQELAAKQEKISRRAAAHQRLNELNEQLKTAPFMSDEWWAIKNKINELNKL